MQDAINLEDAMEEKVLRQEKVAMAISIGEELIRNGGEVYRVEDTLRRILNFYGFFNPHIYVVSNGIFITVEEYPKEPISSMRCIENWSVNLEKIAKINTLSRDICAGKCSVEEAREQLDNIRNLKQSPEIVMMLATAIGSAAFSYTFGGKMPEMLAAFLVGFLLKAFLGVAEKKQVSKFIRHIIGSLCVTIIAVLISLVYTPLLVDKVIIGGIMLLVPGVALTTSIRDFFSGDYLSGGIHFIDALLTAVCIASGVGVAMKAFMVLGMV